MKEAYFGNSAGRSENQFFQNNSKTMHFSENFPSTFFVEDKKMQHFSFFMQCSISNSLEDITRKRSRTTRSDPRGARFFEKKGV